MRYCLLTLPAFLERGRLLYRFDPSKMMHLMASELNNEIWSLSTLLAEIFVLIYSFGYEGKGESDWGQWEISHPISNFEPFKDIWWQFCNFSFLCKCWPIQQREECIVFMFLCFLRRQRLLLFIFSPWITDILWRDKVWQNWVLFAQ